MREEYLYPNYDKDPTTLDNTRDELNSLYDEIMNKITETDKHQEQSFEK